MAANKPRWPACGCDERCKSPKCQMAGGRETMRNGADTGIVLSVAQGLMTRRYTPQTLQNILKAAAACPVVSVICSRAKIHRTLLRYWLEASRKGNGAFNIKMDEDRTEWFHVLFEDAMQAGFDKVEQKAFNLATGIEREILHHQGRVQYKYDDELLRLGYHGEEAYLRDTKGEPIPETVPIVDPEMVRWILSRRRPDQYGNKLQVEHEHKGGVLVVGAQMTAAQVEKTFGGKQAIEDIEFEEVPQEPGNE